MRDKNGLEEIVGKKNILDDWETLEAYKTDMSFVPPVRPRCIVKPGNAQEVQAIVKWANETNTPLVPVSSKPPHFRGDTVPRAGGSVIVDLTRMKAIMRIDAKNRVAWVEAGVTYGELTQALKKEKLSACMPLCPRSSKSVLTSMVEREPITMPAHHFDATDPFLCGEVIYGTGDRMRTGEAAGPEPTEEQWKLGKSHMVPFGLSQMDENKLLSGAQGSIGILTWATLKCRPASEFSRTFFVPSDKLESLFGVAYSVLRARQCDHLFIVNDLNLAGLLAQDSEEIKALREILPPWALVVSFEGNGFLPEDKVAWQEADFREMVARTTGLTVNDTIPGATGEELSQILSKPSEEPYWKLRYKGGCSELFFLSTLDKTPTFIDSVSTLASSKRLSPTDIGVYIQPIVQGTSCHCEFDIFYDPSNTAEAERAKRLNVEGAAELANKGAYFSRPYEPWVDIAYGRAADTATMQRKLKQIFDPNDVMNPGRLCF